MIIEVLKDLLSSNNFTLATAESCTGGMISERITSVPGASNYFLASCVTYSNESKIKILGVCKETLMQYGAVSVETAAEMASGIRKVTGADIGLSTTGIAGPGGGTELKPVGTVCFGIDYNGQIITKKEIFKGDRDSIRKQSCDYVLNLLIDIIDD